MEDTLNPEERNRWRQRLDKVQRDYLCAKQRCDVETSVDNLRELRRTENELDRLQSIFNSGRVELAS
ncbi:MAG: hypothetical protein VYA34_14115 [Myxococcota bacterium]|nr:hypothetical protein [Myxococcota bacterium]